MKLSLEEKSVKDSLAKKLEEELSRIKTESSAKLMAMQMAYAKENGLLKESIKTDKDELKVIS